jgi:hypothetical protein
MVTHKKASVVLEKISDDDSAQGNFFGDGDKDNQIMRIVDLINSREGAKAIVFASCGLGKSPWLMKQMRLSLCCLTGWCALLPV